MRDVMRKIVKRLRGLRASPMTRRFIASTGGIRRRSEFGNLYHCCIQKSGSQWIKQILSDPDIFRLTGMPPFVPKQDLIGMKHRAALHDPIPAGHIVTPLYVRYTEFEGQLAKPQAYRAFWVMRDPRDLMLSRYFSLRYSHALIDDSIAKNRETLSAMNESEALTYMLKKLATDEYERLFLSALSDWMSASDDPRVQLVRYEDLVGSHQFETFRRLMHFLGIPIPDGALGNLLDRYSFRRLSGRAQGKEDQQSHYRKGEAGDWRNHFTEGHKTLFKQATGNLLVELGYEKDVSW